MRLVSRFDASERRLLFLVLASLLILAAVLMGRSLTNKTIEYGSVASAPPLPPVELSSDSMIIRWQEVIRSNPENTHAYAQLGLGLLQKVRENGDVSLYGQAETAFNEALKRDPRQADALIGQGILALARHDFITALQWAEQARAVNPYRAEVLGILVDAQIELGRYEEAAVTGQAMVDMRPDLASYSRVSYLRELHGDVDGAIIAIQAAVDAGAPGTENRLWTLVQLGHLYFNSGDWRQAAEIYQQALNSDPDYVHASAGLARIQAAQGEYETAVATYQSAIARLPMPEFVIALGELYEATGQLDEAEAQYELVQAIQQLNAGAGVDVDLELALFNAEHGSDPAQVIEQARAIYARRPTIYAADILAWALYQNGEYDEARQYSQEALRLGTHDALLHYHAGIISAALGNNEEAQTLLSAALAINPHFNPLHAPIAQATLEQLQAATD